MGAKPKPRAAKRAPRTPALEPPAEPRFVRGEALTPELAALLARFVEAARLKSAARALRVQLEVIADLLRAVPPDGGMELASMRTPLRLDARARAVAAHRGVLGELLWLLRQRREPIAATLDHGRAPFAVVARAKDALHGRARRGSPLRLAEGCELLCSDCRGALLQDLARAVQEVRAAEVDALIDATDRAIVCAIGHGADSADAVARRVFPQRKVAGGAELVRTRIRRLRRVGYDGIATVRRKTFAVTDGGRLDAQRWVAGG